MKTNSIIRVIAVEMVKTQALKTLVQPIGNEVSE